MNPVLVFVFSGKRKSGKDYITGLLSDRIGKENCSCIQLSGPLKKQYALDHNLEYEKLMDSSIYKEKYRADMIKWGEDQRRKDPGYFCQIATNSQDLNKIWIISDARRKTDLSYFTENFRDKTYSVRVTAKDCVRERRGFMFTPGVDDAESECGLDNDIKWNFAISNNGDEEQLYSDINQLANIAMKHLGLIT